MDHMEEDSDHDGQNISCRIDHDNSINHLTSNENQNEDTRRLVDGGPLSNHLIDLERQQIYQQNQASQISGLSKSQQPQSTLFSSAGLNCLETSLEESNRKSDLKFRKNSPQNLENSDVDAAARLAFYPENKDSQKEQLSKNIDWHTSVMASRIVIQSSEDCETRWEPQSFDYSKAEHQHHQSDPGFTFYPSQPSLRDLQNSDRDFQTQHTHLQAKIDTDHDQMLTARTIIQKNNPQQSCFEPRFEHEEALNNSNDQLGLDLSKISDQILCQQLQSSHFLSEPKVETPKVGSSPKIDINEGPQEMQHRDSLFEENKDDFIQIQKQTSSPLRQGGVVPKQRLLTLEDAAEAQKNNLKVSWSDKLIAKENQNGEDENMWDPADYTDHLYDSDEGSAQQSQNWRQSMAPEIKTNSLSLRQSAPQQQFSKPSSPLFSKRDTTKPQFTNSSNTMQVITSSNSNPELPVAINVSPASSMLKNQTARSQPNLLFQPFQRIQSLNDINSDPIRHNTNNDYTSQPAGNFAKVDDLRDSSTTAITQMIQNQNHNSVAIVQEQSGSNYTWSPQEEQKIAHNTSEESKKSQHSPSSFHLPNPNQIKDYEKMVAQIIRDSIEKENRALKQQIKQLQLNEQKRNSVRNPFQPKNAAIFSKPKFAVSKPFSGRNSGFKYRPGSSFNFQHPNRSSFQGNQNAQSMQMGVADRMNDGQKKDESFEDSEVIEELIEVEESGDEQSGENSITIKSNLARGRGSMGSICDDAGSNLYAEESKHGGRLSPHAVLSQRFFNQQSFYGFRRDLSRFQRRSNMACTSALSQNPDNQELEFEDLEALFNYQGDNFTENDEGEAPFYVPSCLETQRNQIYPGSELHQDYKEKLLQGDALTQVNMSPNHRNENQSVDAIYKYGSDNGNHQRRMSLNSIGNDKETGERQNQKADRIGNTAKDLFGRDKQKSHSSRSCAEDDQRNSRMVIQKDFGHLDDDDMVNQNSSHDGRSHNRSRVQIDLTQSTFVNEHAGSPLVPAESALLLDDMKKSKKVEKATQMSECNKLRKSNDSSVKKLEGPQRFTYFSASSLADDRWICPICLDVYQDAVETPCCHNLFCEKCIRNTRSCPLCNMRIIGALKPNIPIRRLVLELQIQCPNQNCKKNIKRCDLDRHLEGCMFTLLSCPNSDQGECGLILRQDMQKHTNDECIYRQVACLLNCGVHLVLNDMDEHIANICTKYEFQCGNQCGKTIERGKMEEHLRVDCPDQIISCPNKGESLFEDGCSVKLRRKSLEQHRQSCAFRRITCPNQKCASVIMFKNLDTHDERCLFKIVECDNKCGSRVLRQNIQQHRDVCEYQLVRCPYYDLGCKIEILRKDYREHLIEENFNHSIVFIEGQKKKNKEIEDLQTEIASLRKDYDCEMQWMYVEMQMMKAEMKKIVKKDSSSGDNNQLDHQNSSFGELQPSFQRRTIMEESKKENQMQHYSFVFARGAQQDQNAHNGHFGGRRYNQTGAQSMSVASASVAQNRQSNNFQNNNRLNQGQLIDIFDELEPRTSQAQQNQNFDSMNQSRGSGTFEQRHEVTRPTTRRGRDQIGRIGLAQQSSPDIGVQQNNHGIPRSNNFDERFDASSVDYLVDRQNSIRNSREHFLNEDRQGQAGLSNINPLTAIDGARNQNDSEGRNGTIRQSLSAAANNNLGNESNSRDRIHNTLVSGSNAKPPLFRHQMMLRVSEPNYSASQNNDLSVSHADRASLVNRDGNIVLTSNQEQQRHEGSDRKNPLGFLLASANASIDTSTHPQHANNLSTNQANVDDNSPYEVMERFSSSLRNEDNNMPLSTTQKQQLLQHMRNSTEQQQQKQEDERRYRDLLANGALLSSVGSAPGGLRQHRIRKVQGPNRARNRNIAIAHSQGLTSAAAGSQAVMSQTANVAVVPNMNDLDSSNVLYDEDFEIEEEKKDSSTDAFPENPSDLFNP